MIARLRRHNERLRKLAESLDNLIREIKHTINLVETYKLTE